MTMRMLWKWSTAMAFCALMMLGGGCKSQDGDPLEGVNRLSYKFNNVLDRYVLKPASDVYVKIVPDPIRTGVGNAFENLTNVNVILNDVLQGKLDQGWKDTQRFAVNTTVGVAGVFDVATKWNLPQHSNDFGTTLGKWGVKPGPYLVLPFYGPSTVRDAPGIIVARYTNPLHYLYLRPEVDIPLTVLDIVDTRSRIDYLFRFRDEAALDPYLFTRNAYLQLRDLRIHDGVAPPSQSIYDEEPAGPTTQPVPNRPNLP